MPLSEAQIDKLCGIFKESFLIVGLGSPLRGDDQAGLLVCEELQSLGVECIKCEYGLENCTDYVMAKKPRALIILDAALFENGCPGDIVVTDEGAIAEGNIIVSTHSIPLRVVLSALKSERAFEKVFLIGIYPDRLDLGLDVSSAVLTSVNKLANYISTCVKGS
ncbi:MAG: hydrogenase maturation protease [Desulfurococcaceae archaeon]